MNNPVRTVTRALAAATRAVKRNSKPIALVAVFAVVLAACAWLVTRMMRREHLSDQSPVEEAVYYVENECRLGMSLPDVRRNSPRVKTLYDASDDNKTKLKDACKAGRARWTAVKTGSTEDGQKQQGLLKFDKAKCKQGGYDGSQCSISVLKRTFPCKAYKVNGQDMGKQCCDYNNNCKRSGDFMMLKRGLGKLKTKKACEAKLGYKWDGSACVCNYDRGFKWDGANCVCDYDKGYKWDGSNCVCNYEAGYEWNSSTSKCVKSSNNNFDPEPY